MPWERVDEGDVPLPTAVLTKARLYADEDIEEELVEYLREKGVNIKSARELGHRGKPDEFHAALAFKQRRFLLTKNAKHFLADTKLPMHRTHGVIAIEGSMANMERYALAALHVLSVIVPFGGLFEGSKISVSANRITLRYVDASGKMVTDRFKIENRIVYRWV